MPERIKKVGPGTPSARAPNQRCAVDAVADKLVYVHEALHLKHKLQKASYTQHVEKWDSDSDSDESDDEDDLKV